MIRYLLDTNVVIGLLRETPSPVACHAREKNPSEIALSAIVAHELYFGAFKSERAALNLTRLHALRFEVLPLDKEDSIAAGEVRAKLIGAGTPIGPFDVLIAGQALSRSLVLVTANVREFRRVEGLQFEDWSAPS